MKIRHLLTALFGAAVLAGSPLAAADPFEIPSFLKQLDDLDEVMSDAAREKKGITFLLMQPGST